MASNLLPLEIRCFGPPTVRVDGREPPPDVLWRKNLALLVYLALSPRHTRSREHLLALLWPDKEETRARHSLNEAVRRLRAALGADRLVSQGDALTLEAERLTVDALGEAPPEEEFLDGLVISDAPEFETWLSAERMRHRDRATERLLSAGETALAAGDYDEATGYARRVRALDPEREAAVRLAMRARALHDDAAGALRLYHEFEEHLRAELGEAPGRSLAALAERIRAAEWRADTRQSGDDALPPLVGREGAHATAFHEVATARTAGPRTLGVVAQAGMGRSRLLQECAARWRLDGGLVATAHPVEGDREAAWSTLRQLMRGGLLDAPGLAATEPAALRTLASVVPSLAERFEPLTGMGRADLADALGALLRALTDETPIALVVDDAHLADDDSLAALRAACAGGSRQPLLLVVSVLEGAPELPEPLNALLGEIGRGLPGEVVHLGPLHEREIRELVQALASWCHGAEQQDRLARRIAFESGGDPIFAVTLLEGLAEVASLRSDALIWPPPNITLEAPVPFDVPHLVRMVTSARVRRLEDRDQQVLLAACVGGRAVDPQIITAMTDEEPDAVEESLATLERRRFVRFEGERYVIAAKLIADVVLADLVTPGQRSRLHSRYEAAVSGRPSRGAAS